MRKRLQVPAHEDYRGLPCFTPSSTITTYEKNRKLTRDQKKVAYIYSKHTTEDLERACRIGHFPTRPSNLFLKIYSDVLRTVESYPGSDIVAPNLVATSGVVPLTINAPFDKKEILIAAGFWKVGKATNIITTALHELNSRIARRGGQKVVVKILWGRGGIHYHKKNSPREKVKLNLPTPSEAPFLEIESMDMHKAPLGVFHVKYMIVDRKILLITSTNIQDKNNVEFVVHMEGKVVDSFYSVFHNQWMLDFVPPLPLENVPAPARSGITFGEQVHGPCIFHSEHAAVPMFLANKLPGSALGRNKWEVPQNVAWLSAMHHAQRSIVIETPDFNAALAVKSVMDACKRGIQVTIRLSWVYNAMRERVFLQGGTNVHVIKKIYKKLTKVDCHRNLTVFFFVARTQTNPTKVHPNHTKFMAIDDEVAIFGSGNMDTQSWHHSQEVNIAVNSPLLVKEWTDLFRISQNTHLFGMINPNLSESPKVQIERMLAKQNAQPIHVYPSFASPPVINNSQTPVNAGDAEFSSNNQQQISSSYNNNFNAYYNTFRGIYNSPEQDNLRQSNSNNSIDITNSEFFTNLPPTRSEGTIYNESVIYSEKPAYSLPAKSVMSSGLPAN